MFSDDYDWKVADWLDGGEVHETSDIWPAFLTTYKAKLLKNNYMTSEPSQGFLHHGLTSLT